MTAQFTYTAPILLPGDPSLALQASTKQYADTKVASVTAGDSTVTIGGTATAPTVKVNAITESQVTSLTSDLAAKVPSTRNVTSGTGLTGGGALSADLTLAVSYGTTSGTAAQGNDSRITGAAPAASPSFTGTATFGGAMVQTPVVLTGTTVAVNAALGNTFTLTLTGSTTISAPTNAVNGQMIMFRITQPGTGGPYTVTWSPSTGGYAWGADITVPTLSTTASKTDYIGFIYSSAASLWHGLAYARGY